MLDNNDFVTAVTVCRGLSWFALVCLGLPWFVVVCRGLSRSVVVCLAHIDENLCYAIFRIRSGPSTAGPVSVRAEAAPNGVSNLWQG
jgi:hypothetical protein